MTTYRGYLSDEEIGLLCELAVAPLSKAGTVVRSNMLTRLSRKGLCTWVMGSIGGRKAQAHVITVAGAEWLQRHPVATVKQDLSVAVRRAA